MTTRSSGAGSDARAAASALIKSRISFRAGEYRQYPGVAVEMTSGNLAAGEEADQRHIAERIAQRQQFGVGRAEMRAATPRTTDVEPSGDTRLIAFQFRANFGCDSHQIEQRCFGVAGAESELHSGRDL